MAYSEQYCCYSPIIHSSDEESYKYELGSYYCFEEGTYYQNNIPRTDPNAFSDIVEPILQIERRKREGNIPQKKTVLKDMLQQSYPPPAQERLVSNSDHPSQLQGTRNLIDGAFESFDLIFDNNNSFTSGSYHAALPPPLPPLPTEQQFTATISQPPNPPPPLFNPYENPDMHSNIFNAVQPQIENNNNNNNNRKSNHRRLISTDDLEEDEGENNDATRRDELVLRSDEVLDLCHWCLWTNAVRTKAYFYGIVYRALVDPNYDPESHYSKPSSWMFVCGKCSNLNVSTTRKTEVLPPGITLDDTKSYGLLMKPIVKRAVSKRNAGSNEPTVESHYDSNNIRKPSPTDATVSNKTVRRSYPNPRVNGTSVDKVLPVATPHPSASVIESTATLTTPHKPAPAIANVRRSSSVGTLPTTSSSPSPSTRNSNNNVSFTSDSPTNNLRKKVVPFSSLTREVVRLHAKHARHMVRVVEQHLSFTDTCVHPKCRQTCMIAASLYIWGSPSDLIDDKLGSTKAWLYLCPECGRHTLSQTRSGELGPFNQEPTALSKSRVKNVFANLFE